MRDEHRADQPERPLRSRLVSRWHPWRRRTFQDRRVTAGAIPFHPQAFNYLIDPQYLAWQAVLNPSAGVAMVDIAAPVLPWWPWGSTRQWKNSRLPRPIGPQRADRRRLIRSLGPWRRHPHPGGIGDVKRSPADTLSAEPDTTSAHSAPGVESAGSQGAVADGLPDLGSLPLSALPVSPAPPPSLPVDPWLTAPHTPPQRVADTRRQPMRLSALFEEFCQFLRVEKGRPQRRLQPIGGVSGISRRSS